MKKSNIIRKFKFFCFKYSFYRFYKFNLNDSYIMHSLKLFGVTVWSFYKGENSCWFRIFGKGLSFVNSNYIGLTFFQRYKYSNYLKIGKYVITSVNS